MLTAKRAASAPTTAVGRAVAGVRGLFIGRPLASEEESGERLSKTKALAIFSSDAISSSAYATEEILRVLLPVGVAALLLSVQISIAIALLLAAVAFSYRQVCLAYPNGGGSYTVSKVNLGRTVSLVAASALLIDYVLTVSVSTSSAVEQIVSAAPGLHDVQVFIGVGAIALITIGNLRGLREAGNIFAIPTYLFVVAALIMIGLGTYRILVLGEGSGYTEADLEATTTTLEGVTILLVLRAFAAGSVALTGTEAIATGVPAFKPPESRNAATTLLVMAVLLAILFIGITFLAAGFGIVPGEGADKTVIAQVAETVYGAGSIPFYLFSIFTALLLFLAANTSFNAFPRLLAILGYDGFMPRQMSFRGDRLAFSYGIIVLAIGASILVAAAGGETHLLIPLYAVGVFIDFTISQSGMVRHWLTTRAEGWRWRLTINAAGAVLTGGVALIVTFAKAPTSLLVLVLIPSLVLLMSFIRRQYDAQASELEVQSDAVFEGPQRQQRVVIPVNGINRSVIQSVNFGRTLASDVRAVYVSDDVAAAELLRRRWEHQVPGVPLVIVESPYRAIVGPVVAYLDVLDRAWPPDVEAPVTIVVLPEYVARHWWDRLLYNQAARRLKAALVGRPHTVIADVPYRREH
ncbi:MAG TPA: APC family permease [Candidatus Limnocylindrales bacterium]|nr:APC family permease [Candidatus Limnocylindrales bacterium]